MPVLYHYTCAANLKGILQTGMIVRSGIVSNTRESIQNAAICLTSDPSPEGHGLPDGKMYSQNEVSTFRSNHGNQSTRRNHMAFRLSITIPENEEKLVSAKCYYQNNLGILTGLEIGAYFTNKKQPTDSDLFLALESFGNGTLLRKGVSWYYYFDDIPNAWIKAIGVLTGDHYLEGSLERVQEILS